jgi:hypothetical protein
MYKHDERNGRRFKKGKKLKLKIRERVIDNPIKDTNSQNRKTQPSNFLTASSKLNSTLKFPIPSFCSTNAESYHSYACHINEAVPDGERYCFLVLWS